VVADLFDLSNMEAAKMEAEGAGRRCALSSSLPAFARLPAAKRCASFV
jgi:hypothetical protein